MAPMVAMPRDNDDRSEDRHQKRTRIRDTRRRAQRQRGRPVRANLVRIVAEPNAELDVRKLSRAFLSLALHRAATEAEAEQDHATHSAHGDDHEPPE